MMLDVKITVNGAVYKQTDLAIETIKKCFEEKGMTVLMEYRNIMRVNGEVKSEGDRLEFSKTAEGRSETNDPNLNTKLEK